MNSVQDFDLSRDSRGVVDGKPCKKMCEEWRIREGSERRRVPF